jgi:hypothetical protein
MIVSASTQIRSLAKAVATAFASAPLTNDERRPEGGIAHKDLPWSCPPLITDLVLEGAMQDHLDAPINVTAPALMQFWRETMKQMWHQPSRVLKNGTYANLGAAMAPVRRGQRALRFSAPIGAPSQIHEIAAITLSLEVAHCARISLPTADVLLNDDDYIVTTADGMHFGVNDGMPLIDSPWRDFNASGMVEEMMRSPRGEVDYTCHYDQLASLRSILHTNAAKFPNNFEALDQALQALRYLSMGTYCPELVTEMIVKPQEVLHMREKENALFEAIEVMRTRMSDRAKLYTLKSTLVPTVMTTAKFKREVFSASTFPFSMAPGKDKQIEENLVSLYKNEIPAAIQRTV